VCVFEYVCVCVGRGVVCVSPNNFPLFKSNVFFLQRVYERSVCSSVRVRSKNAEVQDCTVYFYSLSQVLCS